jgi:hypothetical protein
MTQSRVALFGRGRHRATAVGHVTVKIARVLIELTSIENSGDPSPLAAD